ncbi:MAG: cardiolipin synthase B [Acidobacteria bacterium]|nr:cardiolipin synthase B [Acidobacteriota bacterium]MBI3263818.1 cardiolipin synthase B [Acidobacteriota bacterium]
MILLALAILGAMALAWFALVVLFTPAIPYHLRRRLPLDSPQYLHLLSSLSPAEVFEGNRIDVLKNGSAFYPAMVDAIATATRSVNFESYIFHRGETAEHFITALVACARRGVPVTLVVDAVGSFGLLGKPLRRLRDAGCRVYFYQGLRWFNLHRLNNRTHREILVVDGRVAFVGGAGVSDWWALTGDGHRPWRDTMARVEGPIVASLQGTFAENLLECSGEILAGDEFFPPQHAVGQSRVLVIKSSPSDRATVSRVLFQSLIECAGRDISLATPYFLPDAQIRRAMLEAVRRGVLLRVLVPGSTTDQCWVRIASRRMYGQLVQGGVRIFEDERSMMHQKLLVADGLWTVIGTTNLDNRSFEHNDEVNIAILDRDVAESCRQMFGDDLKDCREVTLDDWRRRPLWEKAIGRIAWILERQQ